MHSRQTGQSLNYEIGKTFELDLANIIKGIAFHEISIENAKIKAAENPHFNVYSSWESIDIINTGSISKKQLTDFLEKNGTPCSELEALYLVNLISNGQSFLSQADFIHWFLPYTNYNLKALALKRKENNLSHRRIQAVDNATMQDTSERLAAQILTNELNYNYDIENLKKQFLKDHSHNLHDISSHIVFSEQGFADFKRLSEFMRRLGIQFSEEECKGFFHRSTFVDSSVDASEISYEELIEMIMPIGPSGFKPFRDVFEKEGLREYVIKKAKDFEFDIQPPSFGVGVPKEKRQKNIMQHYQPFRQVFDPFQKGKMTFTRDIGYMKEMDNYKTIYCNPCQDAGIRLKNSSKNGGVRNHDSYYDKYYDLLYYREKSEVYYNKLGKRYALDANSTMLPAQQSILRRIRANSTFTNTNTQMRTEGLDVTQRVEADPKQVLSDYRADTKQTATNKFYPAPQGLQSAAAVNTNYNTQNTMKYSNNNNDFDYDDF